MWDRQDSGHPRHSCPHVHLEEGEITSYFGFLSLTQEGRCFLPSQPLPPNSPGPWEGLLAAWFGG